MRGRVIILGLGAGLVLVAVVIGLSHRRSDHSPAVEFAASAAERQSQTSGPSRAVPAAESENEAAAADQRNVFLNDRVSAAQVIDQRWIYSVGGIATERWRTVHLETAPSRVARVVDHLASENEGLRIVRQEMMWADSLVVVVPREGNAVDVAERLRERGYVINPVRDHDAAIVVRLPDATLDAVPDALKDFATTVPDLEVEPNWLYFPTNVEPDDFDARSAWGLEMAEAPGAWTVGTGGNDVVVAVIDTGIDRSHPDLAANIWVNPGEIPGNGTDDDGNGFVDDVSGWDFGADDNDPSDEAGHGTHVAGIIGAEGNNAFGVVGVNWRVRIISLRIGDGVFDNAATLNALHYVNTLRQAGVPVVAVNASYGGNSFSNAFLQELTIARDLEILLVAAAGNDSANNDATAFYPAGYDVENVIAVASHNQGGRLSSFSSYGATSVDIAAPGTGIRSTIPGGGFGYNDGTSMAAPHVTGAVALLASVEPGITARQRRERILASAIPVAELAGLVATGGRLNLRRVVAPGLPSPKVEISVPAASVIALDDSSEVLALTAWLVPENGVTPVAAISWETVEGPGTVQFSPMNTASTSATFSAPGIYRLRVNTAAGALTSGAEVTVLVGEVTVPNTGLVAWWNFEESTGPALDASGNNRTGIISGARRNPGVVGAAMRFDGLNSSIRFSAPHVPRLSILAWARADSRGDSIFPRVVHMTNGLLYLGLDPLGDDGNGSNLKFTLDDGVEDRVWHTPSFTLGTGELHHLAVTFDAAIANNTPRLYIDGQDFVVGVQGGAARAPDVPVGTGFIGDRGDGARAWDGLLDEIRIYDRELSPAEVAVVARGPVIEAVRASTLLALPPTEPLSVELNLLPAPWAGGSFGIRNVTWSSPDPKVTLLPSASGRVTVGATEAGEYDIRLDLTTDDGTAVARTFIVTLNDSTVATAGYYTGTSSDGGSFALIVDGLGQAAFVGGGNAARYASQIEVSAFGTFQLSDSKSAMTGFIDAGGGVQGQLSGGVTFSGDRVVGLPGAVDPTREGSYTGGVLRSSATAHAVVAGTRVALVIDSGAEAMAGEGAMDGSGSFSFAADSGVMTGSVGSDRISGSIAMSGETRSFVLLRDGATVTRRLINLSVRGPAGQGEETMIAGFVVAGDGELPLLLRGVGPALGRFDLSNLLAIPDLVLYSHSTALAENQGWESEGEVNATAILETAGRVGAFQFSPGEVDSALLASLSRGAYTMHVRGADGGTGTALAEIYDARNTDTGAKLINLSARGPVGTDQNIPIAGFVVGGEAPSFVLLRAVGPGLSVLGVDGILSKPIITVFKGQELFASAAVWAVDRNAEELADVMKQVGAFTLDPTLEDAALLLFLPPGSYTAHVRGEDGATGVVLLEVYFVPKL